MDRQSGKTHRQSSSIEVFIRIRPQTQGKEQQQTCIDFFDQNQICLREKQNGQSPDFIFDRIFPSNCSQKQVYTEVSKQIIDNSFEGINGTIICYGQTSAGKTYTCIGKDLRHQEHKGMFSRLIEEYFERINYRSNGIECRVKISMTEIYSERISDLLDNSKNDLRIRSDKNGGTFIQNLTEKYITSQQQGIKIIEKGIHHRILKTNVGKVSSRSHLLLFVTLYQHYLLTGETKVSKVTIVDLAGSEKIERSKLEGKKLEEVKKINASFWALGKVIKALSEGKKSHVPYRQSKLTRLLQESLGGNSITKLVINICPSLSNENETLRSLRFGSRAKQIINYPKVNKQYTFEETKVLLENAERKIKVLTAVIKQIMKEKGKQNMPFKEFIQQYLKESQSQKVSEENTDSKPLSRVRSFPQRFFMRSRSPVLKINPEVGGLRSNILSPISKKPQSSMISLNKSANVSSNILSLSPQKHQKHQKRKSFMCDFNKSIEIQAPRNLGSHENTFVEDDFELKIDDLNFLSQDGRSVYLQSICSFNSKVINLSICGQNLQQSLNEDCRSSLQLVKIPVYEKGTIQCSIQQIRQNIRKIGAMKGGSFTIANVV